MKAKQAIGLFCLALCGTGLVAQQPAASVRAASAVTSEGVPSSYSSSLEAAASRDDAPESALLQVSTGNAWIADRVWPSPAPPSDGSQCLLMAWASMSAAPAYGFTRRNFNVHEAFTRDNMIKMAHDFVPGQPLPDAPSYVPLSSKEKFDGWYHHTYSADMFVGTAIDALTIQMTGGYRDFGGGMEGYGKRYGTTLISAEASSLFGRWLFPTILHQDPRYFPSTQTNIWERMAYAASRTVITRSDDGRNVVNSSLLLTLLVSSALANGYKPNYDESFQATLANAAAGLSSVAQTNLLNEFWPDIKTFFSRHEPSSVKSVHKKVNDTVYDVAWIQKKTAQQ